MPDLQNGNASNKSYEMTQSELRKQQSAKCSIEVISVPSNPWRALITDGVVQPTNKLIDVIDSIQIKADLPDEDTIDAQPGDTIGSIFLAVTPSTSTVPQLVTIAIALGVGGPTCQATSPNPMSCIVGQ